MLKLILKKVGCHDVDWTCLTWAGWAIMNRVTGKIVLFDWLSNCLLLLVGLYSVELANISPT
jgi:hypothetical protein